jgi:hypothetical protein
MRFDKLTETSRRVARSTSRRSILALLGAGMTGAAAFPVLPRPPAGGGMARTAARRGRSWPVASTRIRRPGKLRLLALLRNRRLPLPPAAAVR